MAFGFQSNVRGLVPDTSRKICYDFAKHKRYVTTEESTTVWQQTSSFVRKLCSLLSYFIDQSLKFCVVNCLVT
jgi:hypothetical protein